MLMSQCKMNKIANPLFITPKSWHFRSLVSKSALVFPAIAIVP
jgi:hypothetical protein